MFSWVCVCERGRKTKKRTGSELSAVCDPDSALSRPVGLVFAEDATHSLCFMWCHWSRDAVAIGHISLSGPSSWFHGCTSVHFKPCCEMSYCNGPDVTCTV